MVRLSHTMKRRMKIGSILLLVGAILFLLLRPKPVSDTAAPVPEPTTAAERFPTMAPPQTDSDGNPGPNTILIKDFSFRPGILRVKAGTAVTIFNADSGGHSVTSDGVMFDTGILDTNEQGTLTFDTPGTYSYHCRRHPAMNATIVVTP